LPDVFDNSRWRTKIDPSLVDGRDSWIPLNDASNDYLARLQRERDAEITRQNLKHDAELAFDLALSYFIEAKFLSKLLKVNPRNLQKPLSYLTTKTGREVLIAKFEENQISDAIVEAIKGILSLIHSKILVPIFGGGSDPNQKLILTGRGERGYIPSGALLPYRIDFEK